MSGASASTRTASPVGSCVVARRRRQLAPAAVYALDKYIDWLKQYAPPEASGMTFSEAGPVPAQGQIAQQVFWYTAFTAAMAKEGTPVVDEDGTPEVAHGALARTVPYWEEGMKVGYQDVGSWTLIEVHPAPSAAKAAWLYAQFVTSKTVDVKKSHEGLTFVRESTIEHESFTERAPKLGGLVEFYRSPARVRWSDTGTNVPGLSEARAAVVAEHRRSPSPARRPRRARWTRSPRSRTGCCSASSAPTCRSAAGRGSTRSVIPSTG
ncbi:MAG: hypothetical protein U5K43_08720 [Halofilum sp. (in: g-proteobacteria)]|nr:hypothetical protein [Halofilum sp. (in: g-proteobacteria)]